MDLFSSIFESQAVPALFEAHGETVAATFTVGSNAPVNVTVVIMERSTEWRQDAELLPVRESIMRIHAQVDPTSGYGGVASVTSHGRFTIDGEVWSVDHADGRGVREITRNLQEIHLIKIKPVGRPMRRKG